MFRRIMFDWYESCPEATEISGYGCTMRRWGDEQMIKEVKDKLKGSGKTVYIMYGDKLDDIFRQYEAG